jgi:hypothetical protein
MPSIESSDTTGSIPPTSPASDTVTPQTSTTRRKPPSLSAPRLPSVRIYTLALRPEITLGPDLTPAETVGETVLSVRLTTRSRRR